MAAFPDVPAPLKARSSVAGNRPYSIALERIDALIYVNVTEAAATGGRLQIGTAGVTSESAA